jgi:serine protease AprX
VAPAVRLVGLKVLNTQGQGLTSNVIRAIEFAVEYRLALGIDIINLSLGHPINEPAATDPLVQAVEAAVRAGIIVVTSAGNNGTNPETGEVGYAGINSPGNAPSAITVGALKTQNTVTRSDDRVADYSSRGPTWYDGFAKPDLVAPGHALVSNAAGRKSTLIKKKYRSLQVKLDGELFLKLSGSSMATAVTTGVAALVLEANRNAHTVLATSCVTTDDVIGWNLSYCAPAAAPPLTPNAVKMILQYTALRTQDDLASTITGSRRAPVASTRRGQSRWPR